jgi:hypothetical protein
MAWTEEDEREQQLSAKKYIATDVDVEAPPDQEESGNSTALDFEKNCIGENCCKGKPPQVEKSENNIVQHQFLQIRWYIFVVVSALMGCVFGLAFAKSHVFDPTVIRDQFLGRRWIMLKMFLSAMGTGAVCLSCVSVAAPKKFAYCRTLWEGTSTQRGWLFGVCGGSVLLGAGMATSGSCPGMVLSQLGTGVIVAFITQHSTLFFAGSLST